MIEVINIGVGEHILHGYTVQLSDILTANYLAFV